MKFNIDELFCEVFGRFISGQETPADMGTILYYIIKSSLTMPDYYKIYEIVFETEKKRIVRLFCDISDKWRKKNHTDFISFTDYIKLYDSAIKNELYCDFTIFAEGIYSKVRPDTFDNSRLETDLGVIGFSLGSFIESGLSIKKLSYSAFCKKFEGNIKSLF